MGSLITRLPDESPFEQVLKCPDCNAVVTGETVAKGDESAIQIDDDGTISVPFDCPGCAAALELHVPRASSGGARELVVQLG